MAYNPTQGQIDDYSEAVSDSNTLRAGIDAKINPVPPNSAVKVTQAEWEALQAADAAVTAALEAIANAE